MKTPIAILLGEAGTAARCNDFIHWFKAGARPGDHCLCGKTVKEPKTKRRPRDRILCFHLPNRTQPINSTWRKTPGGGWSCISADPIIAWFTCIRHHLTAEAWLAHQNIPFHWRSIPTTTQHKKDFSQKPSV